MKNVKEVLMMNDNEKDLNYIGVGDKSPKRKKFSNKNTALIS